jgi:hypothetical protein
VANNDSFDDLRARVAALEQRKLTTSDLPLAALRRVLFDSAEPLNAGTLLLPGSVVSESLLPSSVFPVVTALPTSPRDGEICFYEADATNGVVWMLQYDPGAVGSYDWRFVGGAPLFSEVATSETRVLNSYGDLATVGPSVTCPLAGDYDVHIGANVDIDVIATAWMSYAIGASAATDTDGLRLGSGATAADNPNVNLSRLRRKTALAASTALVAKYKNTGGAGLATFAHRWMTATPVRVG